MMNSLEWYFLVLLPYQDDEIITEYLSSEIPCHYFPFPIIFQFYKTGSMGWWKT